MHTVIGPAPIRCQEPPPGPAMTDADGSTMVLQLEKTSSTLSSFKPTAAPFVPSGSLSLKRPGSASSMAAHAAPFVPGDSVSRGQAECSVRPSVGSRTEQHSSEGLHVNGWSPLLRPLTSEGVNCCRRCLLAQDTSPCASEDRLALQLTILPRMLRRAPVRRALNERVGGRVRAPPAVERIVLHAQRRGAPLHDARSGL